MKQQRRLLFPFFFHIGCQFLYIALSYFFFVQERPVTLHLAMLACVVVVEFILSRFVFLKRPFSISLASIGIANSVLLSMEGFGTFYWPYFAALSAALAFKYCLRLADRPIFNSSVIGVFSMVVIFPGSAATTLLDWHSSPFLIFLVFALGTAATRFAGTIRLCYSYIISFFAVSLLFSIWGKTACGDTHLCRVAQVTPVGFWPLAFVNFGTILFLFHVIGDPITSPKSRRGQVLFGTLLGLFDFLFRVYPVMNGTFAAYLILQALHSTSLAVVPLQSKIDERPTRLPEYER